MTTFVEKSRATFHRFVMALAILAIAAATTAACLRSARPTLAPNGALLEESAFRFPQFEDLPPYLSGTYTRESWAEILRDDSVACSRLKYSSDGLSVAGFVYAPADTGAKHPVLIFNRGGNRDMGKIGLDELLFMRTFAKSGYVVLGSQYRGSDGGEGRDEFGGRDVDDVLNLLPLARRLGNVDLDNVYMVGHSRGGMMVYLALKRGMRVSAAVAWGAPTDLEALGRERPVMVRYVYSEIIPHFARRPEDALRERSAVEWPEALDTPLLLVHGDADKRVPASQAIELAARLRALGKSCEIVIYPGGDHMLSKNLDQAIERMKAWFRSHETPTRDEPAPAPQAPS